MDKEIQKLETHQVIEQQIILQAQMEALKLHLIAQVLMTQQVQLILIII